MKTRILSLFSSALLMTLPIGPFAQNPPSRLERTPDGMVLMVDGKPFTLLAGELHNSTTGSAQAIPEVWKRMAEKNLNTVIAAASWELVEPVEGQYNFKEVDAMIDASAEEGLKLVILWFGSWKNGLSTYVPAWVKTNPSKYPLAVYNDGKTAQILSALGENSMKADAKAFAAMMAHIRDYDRDRTVIMVQVENEIGTLDQASSFLGTPNKGMRDYSKIANKAFEGKVPSELISYLEKNKGGLHPAIEGAWKRGGYRTSGTWEQVFGTGTLEVDGGNSWQDRYPYITEEIFNCWNYAKYVEYVASAGKKEYNVPMYVNAWIKQERGQEPGYYPSGGAQPHVFDIWRAAAPSIDFYGTDIYATQIYDWVCSTFALSGNPLFIPETSSSPDGASRALYTFGKYGPMCYSPFGIDGGGLTLSADPNDHSFDKVYFLLDHFMEEIRSHKAGVDMQGLLLDGTVSRNSDSVTLGKYTFSLSSMSLRGFAAVAGVEVADTQNDPSAVTGVLVAQTGPDEFLLIGGVGSARLSISSEGRNIGLLSVDEIRFDEKGNEYLHRLNGDETSMGAAVFRSGEPKALRIKLYEY